MGRKSTKNGAYELLVAQKNTISRITGIITPKSIDGLKNNLEGAFTKLKSTHLMRGNNTIS